MMNKTETNQEVTMILSSSSLSDASWDGDYAASQIRHFGFAPSADTLAAAEAVCDCPEGLAVHCAMPMEQGLQVIHHSDFTVKYMIVGSVVLLLDNECNPDAAYPHAWCGCD